MRVRSTSNMQWTWTLVRRDSIMRCAMILRMWFMGTRSPGIDAGAGEPPSDFAGDGGGADLVDTASPELFSKNAVMSCLVMRPPSPVPGTCARLMLCSRAILRTNGDERAWSSSLWEAWACTGWAGAATSALDSETGAAVFAGADSLFAGGAAAGLTAALSPSP